jgi:hypothetical protein
MEYLHITINIRRASQILDITEYEHLKIVKFLNKNHIVKKWLVL